MSFFLVEKLSIIVQKFSKCLKNGNDRLRKGKLRRRGGVVVNALDFRSDGRWFGAHRVVSFDKKLCPRLSLSTQVFKIMGTSDILLGGNPALDLHPIRQGGSSNTLSCFMLHKPGPSLACVRLYLPKRKNNYQSPSLGL